MSVAVTVSDGVKDARPMLKRPRGRPRGYNGVTIYPVHLLEPDIAALSQAFIEWGLHLGRERVKILRKEKTGVKQAGLSGRSKVQLKRPERPEKGQPLC